MSATPAPLLAPMPPQQPTISPPYLGGTPSGMIQQPIQAIPVSSQNPTPPQIQPGTPPDTFAQGQIRPNPPTDATKYRLKHPLLYGQVSDAVQHAETQPGYQSTQAAPGESPQQRIAMFFTLYETLDDSGKNNLKTLLASQKLFRAQAEDRHSTLYHLYAMATTPRLQGIDGPRAARDLMRLMVEPQTIVQTFVTLLPQDAQEMLKQFNLHPVDLPQGKNSISSLDYLQSYSADCVPAAIMARQAMTNYDELARQINEITGLGYFNETVRAEEIWPKNPAEAEAVMNEWHWTYQPVPGQPGTYTVRFQTPESVKMRMVYAHRRDNPRNEQTPIEGGYQGTLAYQGAGKQYNGILGKRWDPTQQLSIGLNAIEKTVLENAIEDGKSIHSVQYQVATGRQTTQEDGDSYLFGYTVPFEEVQNHLLLSLDLGWHPVVGFVETDNQGRIEMAHEIMIKDKKWVGNELYFEVVDTDDDNPNTVLRAARELIPKLHHVSYPFGLAQRIEADINNRFQQFFIPGPEDQAQYNVIPVSRDKPMDGWEEMIWPERIEAMRQQMEQQQQTAPIFPNQPPGLPSQTVQNGPSPPAPVLPNVPTPVSPPQNEIPIRPAAAVTYPTYTPTAAPMMTPAPTPIAVNPFILPETPPTINTPNTFVEQTATPYSQPAGEYPLYPFHMGG